ncbi:uncharacterized protein C8Q71DRAFT_766522 [Rhodofomes roseus]|uniref:BTB domain-containing protein n=1 Tax=Rhodofomes roseus TaxID=34475 RepID=A0ABQ8KBC2_9APHY|nr:uncharacterized protein C8Q71DRAFT_766522 [Rhodofomes roseus]KAH9834815.1 hypothetical protein C8Q71DRAFT_766522 [Rhodofomes roseus]
MDASHSTRKRPRQTDSEDDTTSECRDEGTYVEHPSLYYDDGNVILSSENTLFRAHRSILCKASPVLRDMLEQKAHEDRKPDVLRGCLHIALDVETQVAETLMRIVYNDLRLDTLTFVTSQLSLVTSIFRAAGKFRIERTLVEVYARIKYKWPSDLEKHDRRIALEERMNLRGPIGVTLLGEDGTVVNTVRPTAPSTRRVAFIHPVHILALVRSAGCRDPEILTPLLYAWTCAPTNLAGYDRVLHALPQMDLVRYIRGLEYLRCFHAQCMAVSPTANNLALPGDHEYQCWPGIRVFWADLGGAWMDTNVVFAAAREPIEAWGLIIDRLTIHPMHCTRYNICSGCSDKLITMMKTIRQGLWSNLTLWFAVSLF